MTLDPTTPPDYLVGHVEDALARDERVCEQGLHVTVDGDLVVVTGVVSTEERRRRIPEVVGELLPGFEVRNRATVSDYPEDPKVEHLEVEHAHAEPGSATAGEAP